jgi:hypothetical protein
VKFQQLQSTGSCGIHSESGATIIPDAFTELCLFARLCVVQVQTAISHFVPLAHQATRTGTGINLSSSGALLIQDCLTFNVPPPLLFSPSPDPPTRIIPFSLMHCITHIVTDHQVCRRIPGHFNRRSTAAAEPLQFVHTLSRSGLRLPEDTGSKTAAVH